MAVERTGLLNKPKLVTVFGGSGFVGRHVVAALAKRGYRVRVAVRNPTLAPYLQPLGNLGQIQTVQANLRYPQSIELALRGADHVINLVGILSESGAQRFDAVQLAGARAVAEAAKEKGIPLTHMSAIGADPHSASAYARTKGEAEKAVHEVLPHATIIRPSIIFGPEDGFFNKFANMARFSPFLPLIGGGKTLFQPVYVGDVADMIARTVDGTVEHGRVYELGGPEAMSFRRCMEEMLEVINRKRILLPIPWFAARIIAGVAGLLPKPVITNDQVTQLQHDNVVSDEAKREGRTLEGAGIRPTGTDVILPSYLWRYREQGQFTKKELPPKWADQK
ncbi:3-beta-hydroxy-Delta(5)-steroid dehydrogenase [Brucella endophytica]|uniref:3-beta-hydroxy-Delta(5)-steroid dehydrogenase n=1 Tax=Brucella endophytica TaxID=1963359 RepID=A0A916S3C2_9HYPH|nr:complex I NDUFA9 subunit family protein [Brucella endophytica]GGA79816.1 3-beta-hydroxy-Delta(5)-steroid dehydrogenase [Brucella endophytica]